MDRVPGVLKPFENEEILSESTLSLAYIGDCVYECFVRNIVLREFPGAHSGKLHKAGAAASNCKAQSEVLASINEFLTDEERAVAKRGANSKPASIPKNASKSDYLKATALETLIGTLYLQRKYQRLDVIFTLCTEEIRRQVHAPFDKEVQA